MRVRVIWIKNIYYMANFNEGFFKILHDFPIFYHKQIHLEFVCVQVRVCVCVYLCIDLENQLPISPSENLHQHKIF